ncbi:molybdopterin dinucleotide binding domain-containing protein [Arthrobacter sp. NPDC058130]|uniref:molybdopterin dinucleotide binding domain-containing protein n=1 Tax=Arthrobacter sp. NPDC058130 TaxID=3346353 RepID=UPI0036E67E1B
MSRLSHSHCIWFHPNRTAGYTVSWTREWRPGDLKAQPRPLPVHPSGDDRRGIIDGNIVRVFNGRGSCLAAVRILDGIMESVVQLPTGAWFDPIETDVVGPL